MKEVLKLARLVIEIPDTLKQDLRQLAFKNNIYIKDIVIPALQGKVEEMKKNDNKQG